MVNVRFFLFVFCAAALFSSSCGRKKEAEKTIEVKNIAQLQTDTSVTNASQKITFVDIATFCVDLNNNKNLDTIVLRYIQEWRGTDPGDFHQIEITMDNGEVWTDTDFGGRVYFFDTTYNCKSDPLFKQNQLDTRFILLSDFAGAKIIALVGYAYASMPGILTLIEFSTGKPREIFNEEVDLVAIDSTRIVTSFTHEIASITDTVKYDECVYRIVNAELVRASCEVKNYPYHSNE